MAVLALVFGGALVVLVAVLIRGPGTTRRSAWAARANGGSDSAGSPVFMGSDSGGAGSGGSDCSGSDAGAGCDGGGGGGGD